MKLFSKLVIPTVTLLTLFISMTSSAIEQADVCASCHGVNGISSDPGVPNLAGQQKNYLTSQLKAFKDKKRANPLMNAIAANLSDEQIDALTTFFSQQSTVASQDGVNEINAVLTTQRLEFPSDFPAAYTPYATANRADNQQVRYLYLSNDSIATFKQTGSLPNNATVVMAVYKAKLNEQTQPVVGADGFYEKDSLAAYAVMKKEAGWGKNFPPELANGDWKYGFYAADKTDNTKPNLAKCMACHQPLEGQDYLFMFEDLKNTFGVR